MNHRSLRTVFAAVAMTCAGMSNAAQPTAFGKYVRASVIVGVHNSIPSTCIQATGNAVNTWNAVGANFFMLPDFIVPTPRPVDQTPQYNEANVTIEDGVLSDPRAVMGARVDDPAGIIRNADIRVDRRRILNNPDNDPNVVQLECSTASPVPPDVVDWQSSMLHEFGHVVGLNHDANDLGCSMYEFIGPGQMQRDLCPAEKQAYIDNYKALRITSIPNVSGLHDVNIPAKIFYAGAAAFPIKRETLNTSCPSGWSCGPYNGTYTSSAPSPLTFNFKCTNASSMPTSTFGWRTTLIDANGVRTNSVDHTSTCVKPAGAVSNSSEGEKGASAQVTITD